MFEWFFVFEAAKSSRLTVFSRIFPIKFQGLIENSNRVTQIELFANTIFIPYPSKDNLDYQKMMTNFKLIKQNFQLLGSLNLVYLLHQKITLCFKHLKNKTLFRFQTSQKSPTMSILRKIQTLLTPPIQTQHQQMRVHVIQNGNFRICNYIFYISVEIIHHLCMQNHQRNYKVKQDQRDSNPIYKIVTNKIRNINKKLSQLNQLQSSDKKGLTQAQLAKLAKREELAKELAKQEDFLAYYKQLVVENNLVYDKVDDLIKVSTFLAVGKRIQKERYCPEETKQIYNEIYNQIFFKSVYNGKNQLSDEIIRVYRLLEAYLEKSQYFSQCKDYMTYIKEIDLRKPIKTFNHCSASEIMQHVQQTNSVIKGKYVKNEVNIEEKIKKLAITKQVVHFKQENSKLTQKVEQIKNQMKANSLQKQLIEAYPTLQKVSESESTLPDLEDRRKDSYTQMTEQSPLKGQGSSKSGDFSKKGQPRENNSEEKIKQSNSNKRKRKNKKQNYVQVFEAENMRKCSEMLCDGPSEMSKPKKVRYVEKAQ